RLVLENGADLGVAFDGDADRIIAVDEKGEIIDGDHILAICGSYLKGKGE
ncbi:MAG TPA: phosphoglucosamine mutase, partial [Tissierellales bacterium]|nr:phosphoglucosamine mutase [Tissierellales bacterium]